MKKRTEINGHIDPFSPPLLNGLDEVVKKYGFLPMMFNSYNCCEIKEKSHTLTAQCNRWDVSSACILFERVKIND